MSETTFADLQLSEGMLATVAELGYEAPTPIQEQTIRLLIEGRDVIAQAQTGTGKTAAFAIPIVECVDQESKLTQALVLAPTRELAVQVAAAVHRLGHSKRLSVLPVYGGQPIERQLHALSRGVQVVIGTPGRVLDHLRRGTLQLGDIKYVVLDEADEMLDMGFLEDIESILDSAPPGRQMALFSATIPPRIAALAQRYLHDPVQVMVQTTQMSVPTIAQFYVEVTPRNKLDALTRVLDHEEPESAMIFARTRRDVDELGEALQSRGFDAETLHGDLNQAQRDRVLQRFRSGQVDLLVATQVAARGLDITGVTHVFNYAIPEDAESYVHRIGRTGRAGRAGKAITLVQPNEIRWLRVIERIIGQKITPMRLPTLVDIETRRREAMKACIRDKIAAGNLLPFMQMVTELAEEFDLAEIAAAAAKMASDGERPLTEMVEPAQARTISDGVERGMVRLVMNLGREAGVRPGDIVGAIANEAGIPGRAIGAIDIYDRVAFVEVPADDRDRVLEALRNTTIKGRKLQVEVADGGGKSAPPSAPRQFRTPRGGPEGPRASRDGRTGRRSEGKAYPSRRSDSGATRPGKRRD
ncbi:MAG TPA: DEAD/DEAH box helicase [Chloroflexia bacterium]|jgi:ATP-dependent RNA helicase DeaD|nr:DEAD/DEAH box helicase [Chloroflexia bacterium]